ncbi:MAG: hypothetical protein K9J12_11770 [Melioribacteraceae bacterium]|nr:hypothetical protein [Melioribacteraceae bacterium]MCF8264049.1 hypothetical protein [Melioribacteraceae bacterium]
MKFYLLKIILFLSFSTLLAQEASYEKYLEGIEITDIHGDDGVVWIATRGQGIFKYEPATDNWANFSTNSGNLNHDFFYSLASSKEFIFAGSTDGLFIMSKRSENWQKRKFGKGGQLSNWIRSIAYDKYEDALWIGRFKYLSKYEIRKRRFYDYDLTVDGDIKSNTIISIAVDADSLVWFGTEAGLHRYDKRKDIESEGATTFFDNSLNYFNAEGEKVSVTSILFEQESVWIGLDEFITSDNPDYNIGGLFKYNRKNDWYKFSTRNGLSGNGIYCLEMTGKYIWAGLYQFDRATAEPFGRGIAIIDRVTEKAEMLYFDFLPQTVFTMFYDGKDMWFGTKSGVLRLDLHNDFANFGAIH